MHLINLEKNSKAKTAAEFIKRKIIEPRTTKSQISQLEIIPTKEKDERTTPENMILIQ